MSDLFTATRPNDLPPRWDGHPVTWEGWKDLPTILCGKIKREPCHACGSPAQVIMNVGTIAVSLAQVGVAAIRRKRISAVQHWRIYAIRCPDCRADQVYDLSDWPGRWWDLDPEDYGDDGSWIADHDPARGEP